MIKYCHFFSTKQHNQTVQQEAFSEGVAVQQQTFFEEAATSSSEV
jgi:hypothetical protein